MLFDEILSSYVGEWGLGQVVLLLASSSSWTTLSLIVLSMVFVTHQPSWHCLPAASSRCQLILEQQGDLCDLTPDQYSWDNPHTSLVSWFNLVCQDSWKVGLCNATFFVGYWVGSMLFGGIADKYGRRWCLLLSNLTSAAAATACGLSPTYWWYVAGRTALGFCCSGLPVAAYVLATESVGPSFRGRAGTYSQIVYHFGEWILPLLAYWLQDWRSLNFAIAGCCICTGALAWPLPESPRWLVIRGRNQQALKALQWLARHNGRQFPSSIALSAISTKTLAELELVQTTIQHKELGLITATAQLATQQTSTVLEETGDCTALLLDQETAIKASSTGQQSKKEAARMCRPNTDAEENLWSVFRHRLLLQFFLVTTLLCLVMAVAFYVLNLATDSLGGSLYIKFLLTSVGELPAALVAAVAVDRVGRKLTVGTGLWLTGLACGSCSLLPLGWWTTALASIGKAACSGTWTIAYVYAAELFPTSIRSAALAGTNQASRLGGVLAPAIIYASDQMHSMALPFAVVGLFSILTGALLHKLPETRGMRQPETLRDLESMYGQSDTDRAAAG